jgi:hypothetical protein
MSISERDAQSLLVTLRVSEEPGPGVTACMCAQVVYNVGLCICLFDITKLEDAYVFPGDGASHTKGECFLLGFVSL